MPEADADAPLDELGLVERARSDPDAFADLYRRYVHRIRSYAYRRCGSSAEAEDVTSATFERALRGLPEYRPNRVGLGPWLFRIASNELTDRHRARSREVGPSGQRALGRHADGPVDGGYEAVADDADAARVRRALDGLRPRYQRVIGLRYLADLDPEQAAEAMGLSKATLAVTLHRALAALRAALEEDPS